MKWELLQDVPDEDVRRVLQIARARKFKRGEVVFHRDDPADTLNLIESGRFAVEVTVGLDTATLSILGPGEAFGELSLVGRDTKRSATVIALEPSTTYSIHQLDFDRLRKEQPSVTDVVVVILGRYVRRLSEQLHEALYVPAPKRIRRRLLAVADIYTDGSGPTVVPLTQDTLAQLAGTSRAKVNDVLGDEQRRATVELGRGKITVLDREALERRAR